MKKRAAWRDTGKNLKKDCPMKKIENTKPWLLLIGFLLLLNVHCAESKSLKKGEVYSSWQGGDVIELISDNELEIEYYELVSIHKWENFQIGYI
jgi:hypothetical protein